MRRRTLLGAAATGAASTLSGCGVFTYDDGSTATPDAAEAEFRAARDYLTSIFDRLDDVDIVSEGDIAVSGSSFENLDFDALQQELAGAEASLADLRDSEATPSSQRALVEYGIELAQARISLYTQLRTIVTREATVQRMIDAKNYAAANNAASKAATAVSNVASNGQIMKQLIQMGPRDASPESVPDAFHMLAAQQEAEALSEFTAQAQPAVGLVVAWTEAFHEAVAAQSLLDDESWTAAEAGFAAAVETLRTAQSKADAISSPPPVFTESYTKYSCGVSTLQSAFQAAREAARATRNGDRETAENQFSTYEDMFAEYKTECR